VDFPISRYCIVVVDVADGTGTASALAFGEVIQWLRALRDFCERRLLAVRRGSHRLPWALDGGVFPIRCDVDSVPLRTAEACVRLLREIPKEPSLRNREFRLRVSVEVSDVCHPPIGKRPQRSLELAYHPKLSAVIKNERALGRPGRVTLTADVAAYLREAERRRLGLRKARRPGWEDGDVYEIAPELPDRVRRYVSAGRAFGRPEFDVELSAARAAEGRGDWREALARYRTARSLRPAHPGSRDGLDRCRRRLSH
jgi:hypothetical protein